MLAVRSCVSRGWICIYTCVCELVRVPTSKTSDQGVGIVFICISGGCLRLSLVLELGDFQYSSRNSRPKSPAFEIHARSNPFDRPHLRWPVYTGPSYLDKIERILSKCFSPPSLAIPPPTCSGRVGRSRFICRSASFRFQRKWFVSVAPGPVLLVGNLFPFERIPVVFVCLFSSLLPLDALCRLLLADFCI